MRVAAGLALVAILAASACGGSGGSAGEGPAAVVQTVESITTSSDAPPGSVERLLAGTPGPDVALVMGSADFAVGENRVSFLVLRGDGSAVDAQRARVLVAKGGFDAIPTLETTASLLPVGAADAGDLLDTASVWVANLRLGDPGPYTLLVEPQGEELQAVGQIDVKERTSAPAVGSKAIPSDNPTINDGFADDITTARPPDTELLRSSVKDALADGAPFVVTFATPKFCESRVCGPVVDVVDTVRKHLEGSGIRFIHVEIYENNDPAQGFNSWVREWSLPTEPWTFVVDRDGIIRSRFEGLVTVGELEQAVRDDLL